MPPTLDAAQTAPLKPKLAIEVTEFAQKLHASGDLDGTASSGVSVGTSIGSEFHNYYLNQLNGHKEVPAKFVFQGETMDLVISGRADCWQKNSKTVIEVKSTWDARVLFEQIKTDRWHPYRLQVLSYSWILQRSLKAQLIIVSYADESEKYTYDIEMRESEFENWFSHRCKQIIRIERYRRRRAQLRKMKCPNSIFPFSEKRPGQQTIIDHAQLPRPKHCFMQAPTGLGKTTAVLMGSLNLGLGKGRRVIWLTPKNSQQSTVVSELEKINPGLQQLVMTSKSKICLNEKVDCRASVCKYADDYYNKVQRNLLDSRLRKVRKIDKETLQEIAEKYEVCPYALQKQVLRFSDFVTADFNYVFGSPNGLASLTFNGREKNILVVDEAHNLPVRARQELSAEFVKTLPKKSPKPIVKAQTEFAIWFDNGCDFFSEKLTEIYRMYRLGVAEILADVEKIAEFQTVLDNYSALAIMQIAGSMPQPPFAVIDDEDCWKVICLDASQFVVEQFSHFFKTTLFSATLKPFAGFQLQLGLNESKVDCIEVGSAFPKKLRKTIFIPQISTRWKQRATQLHRMQQVIERMVVCKKGNYLVFAPSYRLAEQLYELVSVPGFETVMQKRGMSKSDVEDLLEELNAPEAKIIFAVQGGVLAEGIDYRGDLAIGCFVVGPGLPQFNDENQKMRKYFDSKKENGFYLTYVVPAMIRAVQSAGRVIRSETDKGLLVFIDDRFMQPDYYNSFPEDWIDSKPKASTSIIDEVKQFWAQ